MSKIIVIIDTTPSCICKLKKQYEGMLEGNVQYKTMGLINNQVSLVDIDEEYYEKEKNNDLGQDFYLNQKDAFSDFQSKIPPTNTKESFINYIKEFNEPLPEFQNIFKNIISDDENQYMILLNTLFALSADQKEYKMNDYSYLMYWFFVKSGIRVTLYDNDEFNRGIKWLCMSLGIRDFMVDWKIARFYKENQVLEFHPTQIKSIIEWADTNPKKKTLNNKKTIKKAI